MSQHTPGPQFARTWCATCTHNDRGVVILCSFHAAAPEILVRLWEMREILEAAIRVEDHRTTREVLLHGRASTGAWVERARALLAKVEGRG